MLHQVVNVGHDALGAEKGYFLPQIEPTEQKVQ
jgi:hypothetical protein